MDDEIREARRLMAKADAIIADLRRDIAAAYTHVRQLEEDMDHAQMVRRRHEAALERMNAESEVSE